MSRVFWGFVGFLVAACMTDCAGEVANRPVSVDKGGVLRWQNDGTEVALMGVNYYPPFSVDYRRLKEMDADFRAVIRQDVAHFRRLGLGCIRLHCFDREFSRANGEMIDNEHVELLDYLIDICRRNGIYTVLTPIAWWGGAYAQEKREKGFSDCYTMEEMTTNREAWKAQARFLTEFVRHVNRFTGKRYGEDPAVLAFECINEPLYPKGTTDATITEYVNTLVDAIRAGGTAKPVYFNSWCGKNAAVGASRADGVTGSTYPTGLVAGHALKKPQLARVTTRCINPDETIATKSRMIYEFDAADTPGAYMYPVIAKMFRSEGVQVANMFQYDPMVLATTNLNWQTHYLNLIYTPQKALSIAIAAEVFRRIPRGEKFIACTNEVSFPPFHVVASRNLSELATETKYYYTAVPSIPPKNAAALEHVWGWGNSPVVRWPGTGAYFLDRVAPGVWRLQVYPDVIHCGDPYDGLHTKHAMALPTEHEMTIRLPDLGDGFTVWKTGIRSVCATAKAGVARLQSGDYLLTKTAAYPDVASTTDAMERSPRYIAPEPDLDQTPYLKVEMPRQWRAQTGGTMPFTMEAFNATSVTAVVKAGIHAGPGGDYPETVLTGVDRSQSLAVGALPFGLYSVVFYPQTGTGLFKQWPDSAHATAFQPVVSRPISLFGNRDSKALNCANCTHMNSTAEWTERGLAITWTPAREKNACAGPCYPLDYIHFPELRENEVAGIHLVAENLSTNIVWVEIGFRSRVKGGIAYNAKLFPGKNDCYMPMPNLTPVWGLSHVHEFNWRDLVSVSFYSGSWLWKGHNEIPEQRLLISRLEWIPAIPAFGLRLCRNKSEWNFLDVREAVHVWSQAWRWLTLDDRGEPALRVQMPNFKQHDAASFRTECDGLDFAELFPSGDGAHEETLVLHARACDDRTDCVELVLVQENGDPWGTDVTLPREWGDVRVPLSKLRYFQHWTKAETPSKIRPTIRTTRHFNFCYGRWLFPNTTDVSHGFEISSIRVE